MASVTETDPDRAGRIPVVEPGEDDRFGGLPPISPDAYELLGEIARGGMGRISRARDRRLGRTVAIKQLLDPTPHAVALFEREVRITARLQHPSIVSVLEAGTLPSGELVYVMKLVPGRALRDVLRDELAVTARLGLLPIAIAIADALAYAHREGVIHRDLKPSNVLVGEFGEVVVIDWGLAHDDRLPANRWPTDEQAGNDDDASSSEDREMRSSRADASWDERPSSADPSFARSRIDRPAVTARAMGTPAYMAPEAARGEAADERADVYAIGAILYETLAGSAPYRGGGGAEIMAAVRAGPPEPIAQRAPGTPADLAAIVDKAMARRREDRYPTAQQLAEELRRFATGQLVSAHVYSIRERARRFVRRHRAPIAVGLAALALVVTLVVIGVSRIIVERDATADRADRLTTARARLELDRDPAAALETLAALPDGSAQWTAARTIAADAFARGVPRHTRLPIAADGLVIAGGRVRVIGRRDGAIEVHDAGEDATAHEPRDGSVPIGGPDLRVNRVTTIAARPSLVALATEGQTVAFIADGRVRAWRTGAEVCAVAGPLVPTAVAVSGDGRAIAAAGRGFGVASWRVLDGARLVHDAQVRSVDHLAVASDGTIAFEAGGITAIAGPARRHEVVGGAAGVAFAGHAVIAASPGSRSAPAGDGEVRFVAGGTGSFFERARFPEALALFVPEPPPIEPEVATRVVGGLAVSALAVSPSGALVAVAGDDRIAVFDRGGRATRVIATRHRARMVAAGDDGTIAIADGHDVWWWSGETDRARLAGPTAPAVAFAETGDGVAAAFEDGSLWMWRGGAATRIGAHTSAARALAVGANVAISTGDDRTVRRWTLDTGAGEILGVHQGHGLAVAIAATGAIASGGADRVVRLWRPRQGDGGAVLGRHAGPVRALAFSPSGAALASVGDDRIATVWSVAAGSAPRELAHDQPVTAVAWVGERTLVTGARDGAVRLWSLDGDEPIVLGRHAGVVRSVASARGAIASAGDDGRVGLGDERGLTLRAAHDDLVRRIAFSRDGSSLVSAGEDGAVRIWDSSTGENRTAALGGWVADAAFARDGSVVFAATGTGVWRIRDDLPRTRDALRAAIAAAIADAR